jgi:hypothetical protein
MSDVKRYKKQGEILGRVLVAAKDGDYVRYDDYAALRTRVAELEDELASGSFYQEKDIDAMLSRAERAEAALATARRDALEEALDAVWETDSVELAKYGVHKIMDRIRALANVAKTMTPVIDRPLHD